MVRFHRRSVATKVVVCSGSAGVNALIGLIAFDRRRPLKAA
jgi:hypothetical protein